MPSRPRIILSLKLYAAAMLALYIAFTNSFDYPYWTMMTVYILALDSSGAMRQKWVYMLGGTVAGASCGVLISFMLAVSQPAIILALMVPVLTAAFFALRDRLPSFYGFMIGAVTCFLVALPGLTTPDMAVLRALYRIQDVAVGASALFLVDTLFLPTNSLPALRAALTGWLGHLKSATLSALRAHESASDDWTAVFAQAAKLDPLASYMPFDLIRFGRRRRDDADAVRTHGLRLVPLLGRLNDIDRQCVRDGIDVSEAMKARGVLADWIERDAPREDRSTVHRLLYPDAIEGTRDTSEASDASSVTFDDWALAMRSAELRCLRRIFAIWQLISLAAASLYAAVPSRGRQTAWFSPHHPTPSGLTQVDIPFTLRVVMAVFLHLMTFISLWSLAQWPSAYAAFGMLLSTTFFIASSRSPSPVATLLKIARIVGIALCIVAVYVTVLLPMTSSLTMVAVVLFPALFMLGTIVPAPGNVLFAVLPMALLRLGNNGPAVDFPTLINSAGGLALGLCSALCWLVLLVRLPVPAMLKRLSKENRADLRDVSRGIDTDGRAFAWRVMDRFILSVQQSGYDIPAQDEMSVSAALQRPTPRMLHELRIGEGMARWHQWQTRRIHEQARPSGLPDVRRVLLELDAVTPDQNAGAAAAAATGRKTQDIADRFDLAVQTGLSQHNTPRDHWLWTDLRLALFPHSPGPGIARQTQQVPSGVTR